MNITTEGGSPTIKKSKTVFMSSDSPEKTAKTAFDVTAMSMTTSANQWYMHHTGAISHNINNFMH